MCRLKELADRRHVEVKREVRCDRRPGWRFKDSESLDFLERNLYRYTGISSVANAFGWIAM